MAADPARFGELAAAAGGDGRLVIVVDQFEEVFTQCADPGERAAFATALAAAAPGLVLIAVRADFYSQCTELPAMAPLLAGQVVAGPLGLDELRRAVHDPARDAGLTLEPGLEELLLTDLGALSGGGYPPGALPLLAHALRATWARRAGAALTVAGYRATGGIRHALAETAERIYLTYPPERRDALRAALLALVTVVGDLAVRRRAAPAEVDAEILRPLIDARLVTAGRDGVELSHEALLTGWPRLAGWLTEAREEILLRQRLAQAADDWVATGDDPDALYRGARLAAAREWAAGRTDLPETQRRFLAAGAEAAEAQERARQRGTRRLRRLAAGLAVALLLAVAGGAVALDQRGQAQANDRIGQSRALALQSRSTLFTDELRSTRDTLDAWGTAHTIEARSTLLSAQQISTIGPLGGTTRAMSVAVSPDGARVAVGYYEGRIELWDASTRRRLGGDLHQPGGNLISLAFSPDGRYLASGGIAERGVSIWDVPGGTLRERLPAVGAVAWRPDSILVAAHVENKRVRFAAGAWDPTDGRLVSSTPTTVSAALSIAVSRDGRYLALTGTDRSEAIRLADRRQVAVLPAGALSVAFGPDDSVVASALDGVLGRWALPSGRRLKDLNDPAAPTVQGRLAITPDGTVFSPSNERGRIVELKLDGGGQRLPLRAFPGGPLDMALSADGHLLAVVGLNSPPMLFRVGVGRLPHPQVVGYVAADPTGVRLASGSDDPVVRIWDSRTSALAATLPVASRGGPLGLAYGPDGTLAAALDNGVIQIFDPAGRPRTTLHTDPGFTATTPAFSPDGTLLAATVHSSDRDARDSINAKPGVADIVVWDLRSATVRARVETPDQDSISVAFTPDGSRLIGASNLVRHSGLAGIGNEQDGRIWAWRTPDFGLIAQHDLPETPIRSLRISPDGRLVAVAAGRQAWFFRTGDLAAAGATGEHPADLTDLAFSPDGRSMATTTESDTDFARTWDVATGALDAELRDTARAGPLAYLPDGKTLAVGSSDWLVVLWDLDPDDVARRLCAIVAPDARNAGEPAPKVCR